MGSALRACAHVRRICREWAERTPSHLKYALTGNALPAPNNLAAHVAGSHWRTSTLQMKKYRPAALCRASNNGLCALVEARHVQCCGESQCKKSMHGASADFCDAETYCLHSLNGSAPHVLRCTTDCQLWKRVSKFAGRHDVFLLETVQNWSTIKFGPVNHARTFRAIHAFKHHTRPGELLLKVANVNLGPSAQWAHVEIRQEPNWSNTRDTEFVAAWGPRYSCGHIQRPIWSGGQLGRGLSSHCIPIRRFAKWFGAADKYVNDNNRRSNGLRNPGISRA